MCVYIHKLGIEQKLDVTLNVQLFSYTSFIVRDTVSSVTLQTESCSIFINQEGRGIMAKNVRSNFCVHFIECPLVKLSINIMFVFPNSWSVGEILFFNDYVSVVWWFYSSCSRVYCGQVFRCGKRMFVNILIFTYSK